MKTSKEFAPSKKISLLLIGTPKSGKSFFASCFPKPYILDCDNNLSSIYRLGNKDFAYDSLITDCPQPEKRWDYGIKCLAEAIKSPDIETIVIDSFSIFSEMLITCILDMTKNDPTKQLTIGKDRVMTQAYWGPYKTRLTTLVMECKAANKHFIANCHEQAVCNEDGAVIAYRPMVQGALRDNLGGYFSDCWRAETSNNGVNLKYAIRVAPRNLFQIGNSLNIKEQEIDITRKTKEEIWNKISPMLT